MFNWMGGESQAHLRDLTQRSDLGQPVVDTFDYRQLLGAGGTLNFL